MAGESLFLRAYQPGDEASFVPTDKAADEMSGFDWRTGPPRGQTWTLCRFGGAAIGVVGLYDGQGGCFHAWTYLSALRPRDVLWASLLARVILKRVVAERPVRAWVADGNDAAFIRKLGFEPLPHWYRHYRQYERRA